MDKEVYSRIAPMKPRLHELLKTASQAMKPGKITKRFQLQHNAKKTYAHVHVTSEVCGNVRTEGMTHASELSELTEIESWLLARNNRWSSYPD